MALLSSLISGKKVDLKEVAGQALAAKLGAGNPNDPKAALKAALAQKLLQGGRVDLRELAGTALAAKVGGGDPDDPKAALKAALIQKLVSGQRVDLGELAGTALAAKLGGGGGALPGGGASLPAPERLSGRDRLEAMLLQQILSGQRIDAQALLVQYLADQAGGPSSAVAPRNFRPGSKAALKNALVQELLGSGGGGGRTVQGELAAMLQRKAGQQQMGEADRQALLGMIAPQGRAPAVPTGYGAALRGAHSAGHTPAGYGTALAPAASPDQAQVDALMAQLQGRAAAPAQPPGQAAAPGRGRGPGDRGPPGRGRSDLGPPGHRSDRGRPAAPGRGRGRGRGEGPAAMGDDQAQMDARMAMLGGFTQPEFEEEEYEEYEEYEPPPPPPPPPTTPAVTRSPGLQARLAALQARQGDERIRIPLESIQGTPEEATVVAAPGPAAAAPAPAAPAPARVVAGIDLDTLERRDPGAAAALSKFSPDVLEAAAALLAAQQASGAAGAAPAEPPPPEPASRGVREPSSSAPDPGPARPRRSGPLASLRTGQSSSRPGARVAELRARRAAEEVEAARPSSGWTEADRGALQEDIEEYWYDEMGIDRFSRREVRLRADAQVRKTLEAVLAGEEVWPPAPEGAPARKPVARRRQVRRATAAREYTVREKVVLHEKIREQVFARERINRFSTRAAKVRAEAMVKTLVTQAMEDGSALDYLEE
jgi:hypothetical protein